jgi:hypothetical protein
MQLVAIKAGFYGGSRVRPGQPFNYTGNPNKLPQWALPEAQARTYLAAEAQRLKQVDTRPPAAAKASEQKARYLMNQGAIE